MASSVSQSKELYVSLVLGVLIPYVLRTVQDKFFKTLKGLLEKYYCQGLDPFVECVNPRKQTLEEFIADTSVVSSSSPADEVAAKAEIIEWVNTKNVEVRKEDANSAPVIPSDLMSLNDLSNSWVMGRIAMGWTESTAKYVAVLRLLLWHWLQPISYCWAFYSYSDDLSKLQISFGIVIAVREGLYFLLALYLFVYRPVALIVNVSGRFKDWALLMLYILSPEKYLLIHLMENRYQGSRNPLVDADKELDWFSLCLLDMAHMVVIIFAYFILGCAIVCVDCVAIAALVIGLIQHDLPLPMALNYIATATSALVGVGGIAWTCVYCFGDSAASDAKEEKKEGGDINKL
jgi:hypothetical protein